MEQTHYNSSNNNQSNIQSNTQSNNSNQQFLHKKSFLTKSKDFFFEKVPNEHKKEFTRFCNEKNISRLPFFFSAMGLQKILSIIVYAALYPILLGIEMRGLTFAYSLYSLLYFIMLVLASYGAKKIAPILNGKIAWVNIIYMVGIAVIIIDDTITMYFFGGMINTMRFLGETVLIAGIPLFTKRKTNLLIGIYLATTVAIRLFLGHDISMFIVGNGFSAILAILGIALSCFVKNTAIRSFLENQNAKERNQQLIALNERLSSFNEMYRQLSNTDPLTKIYNRRAFDEYMAHIWEECRKKIMPVSVFMMDIDRFKAYNDHFGHVKGDDCLVRVTEAISGNFHRKTDMFARFGGEEFVAVVPYASGRNVLDFAEKIRRGVEALRIGNPTNKQSPIITISIGVASCIPRNEEDFYSVVEMADVALYRAKQGGRNRVYPDHFDNEEGTQSVVEIMSKFSIVSGGKPIEVEKLNSIIRATTLTVFSLDFDTGMMDFVSGSVLESFGIDTATETMHFGEFISAVCPADREDFAAVLDKIIEREYNENQSVIFRLRSGEEYPWVSMRIRYTPNDFGVITSAICAIFDFGDNMNVRMIHQLTASSSADCLFNFNFGTRRAIFSNNFPRDFGLNYNAEDSGMGNAVEFAGKFFYKLVFPKYRKKFMDAMKSICRGERDFIEQDFPLQNPTNQKIVWIKFRGRVSFDYKGKPEMLAGSITDITDHVRKEQLRGLIIEGSGSCLYTLDMERNVLEFSPKILEIAPLRSLRVEDAIETWTSMVLAEDRYIISSALERTKNSRNHSHKAEYRIYGPSGSIIWIMDNGKCLYDETGKLLYVAGSMTSFDSMTENQSSEITKITDKFSGLPNRFAFNQAMHGRRSQGGDEIGYTIMVDIDDFSNVNSMYGITIGDRLLTEYGALLTLLMPPDNTEIYHFEGNLFVICRQDTNRVEIEALCDQIREFSSNGLLVDDIYVKITVSVGVTDYTFKDTVDDVLVNVELALRKAKAEGKNKLEFFFPEDRTSHLSRLNLENELRECVMNDFAGFELFYQPIYSTSMHMYIGAEALLRWRNKSGDVVSPNIIIPALKNIGIFTDVERWVLHRAAEQCGQWIRAGGNEDFIININASPKRASKDGLIDEIKSVLDNSRINMKNMFLEITEESLVNDGQDNIAPLKGLQEYGIRMAIDDFGTGYSSLSYLRDLPVCEIKIDRAFVRDIETDETSREFVEAIIRLSHILNYVVCVEGVETVGQLKILIELNADILQGYYFSRPVPGDEFAEKFLDDPMDVIKFAKRYEKLYGSAIKTAEIESARAKTGF
ncbi:MAG: diguanylate cyclase [Defluviitaleaceae bacterium]|nr:diguanylate cyclase [Defluviitaleaceae bacterium]